MAADLAATPVSGITVQLCGDAHLSNFGLFGTPERQMLFDINDFDETLPGPWEWDVADPPLIVPVEDLVVPGSEREHSEALIKKLLNSYRRTLGNQQHPLGEFRYVHTARKVVGVGSVGARCYIMLLLGRDNNDPLFLQVKEAQASVLERYADQNERDYDAFTAAVNSGRLTAQTGL